MRAFEQPSSPVCAETISRRTVLMRTIWTLRFFQKAGMWNFVFPSSPARLSTAQGAESFQGAWAEKLRIRTEPVSVPALILSAPSSGREGAGMGSPTLAEVCRLSSKRFWGKVSRKGGCDGRFIQIGKKGGSWLRQQSVCLQCRRPGFDPWVGKIPWRRKWQPTPVFLPGKSHGRRSLVGYCPWGRKESDTTKRRKERKED